MALFPVFFVLLISDSIQANVTFRTELLKITNHIVSNYYNGFRCVTYITDDKNTELRLSKEHLVFFIRMTNNDKIDQELLTESYEQACGGYVIEVQTTGRSDIIQRLLQAKHRAKGSRYNNQRYLFLPKSTTDTNIDLMKDPRMFFAPNLAVIVPKKDKFHVIGHTFLDHYKHHEEGVITEILDTWNYGTGFSLNADLYPDRLKNVRGKKLVFATVHYSPFALVIKEENKIEFDGFETRVAAVFVEVINGTWVGLDHPVELWGQIYPNGSGSGIVGSVVEHKADLGYGAMYQWYCEETDCSYPFYQAAVTCLVPKPKLVSGWLTIILPYTPDTWTALTIFYFLNTSFVLFILIFLQRIRGMEVIKLLGLTISDAFFTVFRLQLEQIPIIRKSKEPLAIYIKISVYYYFFVAAFWQGGIASTLTVPRYEKPINKVVDLLEKWPKVKWGANSNAWINSIKASTDPNLVDIVQKFQVLDDETLQKKTKTGNFAFFIEKLPHGHYGFNDYIDEESMKYLRKMEGHIYTGHGLIMFSKNSPYTEKFDRTVLRMFDTGLIHKLEVQVNLDRVNNRLQNMIGLSNEKESSNVILAVRHIEGPLYIYLVGMGSGILVFLGEKFLLTREARFCGKLMKLTELEKNKNKLSNSMVNDTY